MASWAAVLAWTGFRYSAVDGSMAFAAREGTFFWANGYAWGTCALAKGDPGMRVELSVSHGELILSEFVLRGVGRHLFGETVRVRAGETARFCVVEEGD
jgi:non-lysosomal glucosylceramidase